MCGWQSPDLLLAQLLIQLTWQLCDKEDMWCWGVQCFVGDG